MSNEDDFFKRLQKIFKIEAEENLKTISDNILLLEKNKNDLNTQQKVIEIVLREAHSLKGSSRSVNIPEIVSICQPLESLFLGIKKGQISISDNLFDIIYEVIDTINQLIDPDSKKPSIYAIIKKINQLQAVKNDSIEKIEVLKKIDDFTDPKVQEIQQEPIAKIETTESENNNPDKSIDVKKKHNDETVRINVNKLDSIFLKTEEMLTVKINTEQRAKDIRKLSNVIESWEKDFFNSYAEMKKSLQKISSNNNVSLNQFNEIADIFSKEYEKFKSIKNIINPILISSEQDSEIANITIERLLEDVKKTLMLPFNSITELFPRMVRDIAKQQEKEIDFFITGGDIEIDKRILEDIKEPLIHLLRNSIDHGIESTLQRKKSKKKNVGKIEISVTQTGIDKIEINVRDDGQGIMIEKVKKKALETGLISSDQEISMTNQEISYLIFNSGFSTGNIITDISGRGLGNAIVKEKIEKLGGVVTLDYIPNEMTNFKLTLPLTLATFRGLLIREKEKHFVLPLINIEKVTKINKNEIKIYEGVQTIHIDQQIIQLVSLSDILNLSSSSSYEQSEFLQVVIIFTTDKKLAFCVDEVLHEQEVMIKTLGKQLLKVANIGGLTVLASGKLVPVINTNELSKTVANKPIKYLKESVINKEEIKKKSILIAEDSITSRTLLKNILETSGYDVTTTVDGYEAYLILIQKTFDLVISDVEMPRMTGFELTKKIRETEKIANIPVILVTSLSSKEHKEKGIEVGANAYIVKTEFDQENLLQIIPKLI
ncbi:MAG: response regulator [Candidatus Sericytochromatia bacterium]|nr:response regulator [Candidatus Sericytochromatia bacterium]